MAAAKSALQSGDHQELERLLVGRRIWVVTQDQDVPNPDTGGSWRMAGQTAGPYHVLSFRKFLPAGDVQEGEPKARGGVRLKHLLDLTTDPGGRRVLSVGSIRLKDPGKVAAGKRAAAALHGSSEDQD